MTGPQIEIIYKTVIILVILSNYFILLWKRGDLFNFEKIIPKIIVRHVNMFPGNEVWWEITFCVLFFYTGLNTSVYIIKSLSNEFEKMLVCIHACVYACICVCNMCMYLLIDVWLCLCCMYVGFNYIYIALFSGRCWDSTGWHRFTLVQFKRPHFCLMYERAFYSLHNHIITNYWN